MYHFILSYLKRLPGAMREYPAPDGTILKKGYYGEVSVGAGPDVVDQMVGGIGEYRIDWGSGYRIYLAQDGKKLIVLFGGGTKQRQQADIKQARALHDEYKARKKAVKKPPRRR
jgi:putative addiction module killer protein